MPPLRTRSRAAAVTASLAWARVYRPTGNPVGEWFFIPLLPAIDLVADSVGPATRPPCCSGRMCYHIAGVRPIVEMMLYTPDLVSRPARAAILSGLEFLRPFFLGEPQRRAGWR